MDRNNKIFDDVTYLSALIPLIRRIKLRYSSAPLSGIGAEKGGIHVP